MSDQVPLSSNEGAVRNKEVQNDLSREVWQSLVEEWGDLAGELRTLNIFLNIHEKYKLLLSHPPKLISATVKRPKEIVTNEAIDLVEIRYGLIAHKDVGSNKPSVWFVLRHRKVGEGLRMSKHSTFACSIQIYNPNGSFKHDLLQDLPVKTVKATTDGSDKPVHALLAMHLEETEWDQVQHFISGRLGANEKIHILLEDSRPLASHISGCWEVKGEP